MKSSGRLLAGHNAAVENKKMRINEPLLRIAQTGKKLVS
jgi:hypothetical protein